MRGNRRNKQGMVFGTLSGSGSSGRNTFDQPKALRIKANVASQFGRSLNQQTPKSTGGTGFSGRSGTVLRRR